MDKHGFKKYLQDSVTIMSKSRSVNSRISKAKKVEILLNINLDDVITERDSMKQILIQLKKSCEQNNISRSMLYTMSNAIRQYYTFKTGEKLPKHFIN